MHLQAEKCVEEQLNEVMGVKGPAAVSLIPYFDVSRSFMPDRVHIIFLDLFKNLTSLWFDTCFWQVDWYSKKRDQQQISLELEKMRPPDSTPHTPRGIEQRKFFKANEWEEIFLFYFPILLRSKLKAKYYKHFLLHSCLCYKIFVQSNYQLRRHRSCAIPN